MNLGSQRPVVGAVCGAESRQPLSGSSQATVGCFFNLCPVNISGVASCLLISLYNLDPYHTDGILTSSFLITLPAFHKSGRHPACFDPTPLTSQGDELWWVMEDELCNRFETGIDSCSRWNMTFTDLSWPIQPWHFLVLAKSSHAIYALILSRLMHEGKYWVRRKSAWGRGLDEATDKLHIKRVIFSLSFDISHSYRAQF